MNRAAPAAAVGPAAGPHPRRRPAAILLACLLVLPVLCAGCGRVPRIIVLEDPLTPQENLDLGVAYERQGKLDLAARHYERALRRDRALVQARVNLGNVRVAQGEYAKAKEEYRKALALRPEHPAATNNLAWAAILSGSDIEDSAARMEALVLREEHRSPALLDTVGVLRMRLSRPRAAEEAFEEAERRCLAAADPAVGDAAASGDAGCPDEVLREIREHREELRRRFPEEPFPALRKGPPGNRSAKGGNG
jgi:tetratricopeptide (TPR) repeat protein